MAQYHPRNIFSIKLFLNYGIYYIHIHMPHHCYVGQIIASYVLSLQKKWTHQDLCTQQKAVFIVLILFKIVWTKWYLIPMQFGYYSMLNQLKIESQLTYVCLCILNLIVVSNFENFKISFLFANLQVFRVQKHVDVYLMHSQIHCWNSI